MKGFEDQDGEDVEIDGHTQGRNRRVDCVRGRDGVRKAEEDRIG